jgi:transcription elongation factor Elf1
MSQCEVCPRTFVNYHAARQHMNAVGHWACESCNDEFWTEEGAEDHMDLYGHRHPRFECEACNNTYSSPQEARNHMDQNNHWRTHWCSSCERGFQNENNLRSVSRTSDAGLAARCRINI